MHVEKIGILHSAGYQDNHPTEAHLPRTPNLMGRFRGAMAAYALKTGIIDKLIVVGGMPDNRGLSVEEGLARYVRRIVSNPYFAGANKPELVDQIFVLPRVNPTFETIMDTREARANLPDHSTGENVFMISNDFHLHPRIGLICLLEGFPKAKLLSAEDIFKKGWPDRNHQVTLDKITPASYLKEQKRKERMMSLALGFDIFTGTEIMRKKLADIAYKRRVIQGKQY